MVVVEVDCQLQDAYQVYAGGVCSWFVPIVREPREMFVLVEPLPYKGTSPIVPLVGNVPLVPYQIKPVSESRIALKKLAVEAVEKGARCRVIDTLNLLFLPAPKGTKPDPQPGRKVVWFGAYGTYEPR